MVECADRAAGWFCRAVEGFHRTVEPLCRMGQGVCRTKDCAGRTGMPGRDIRFLRADRRERTLVEAGWTVGTDEP